MRKKATISIISKTDKMTYDVLLQIKNNKINYQENIKNNITDVLYDKNKKILIRENKEFYMEYNFNINKANIYIKDIKSEVNLNLKVKNIEETKNKIYIDYILNNELYKYIIDME